MKIDPYGRFFKNIFFSNFFNKTDHLWSLFINIFFFNLKATTSDIFLHNIINLFLMKIDHLWSLFRNIFLNENRPLMMLFVNIFF